MNYQKKHQQFSSLTQMQLGIVQEESFADMDFHF